MNGPWVVTSQRETIALDPDTGRYTPMIEVTFRTANNTVATVNVSSVTYSADTVKDAIDAKVAKIDAVANLHRVTP